MKLLLPLRHPPCREPKFPPKAVARVPKKTIASLEQKLEQVGRNEQDEIHRKELNFLEQMQSTEYQNVVRTMSLEALGLRKELGDCKEELRRQQMLVEAYRLRILTAPPKEVKKHEPAGRSA